MIGIRITIPVYAGHADAAARRLSDQQVRAFAGERLAALRERLPAAADSAAFEDALFHCEFGDQHVIKALEDDAFANDQAGQSIEAEDERVTGAAVTLETVDAAGAPGAIDAVRDALAARGRAIVALKR